MMYFNENLRNWLLESSQDLLMKYQTTNNKSEISKINKKLNKLGYEVKTVHILSKKKTK